MKPLEWYNMTIIEFSDYKRARQDLASFFLKKRGPNKWHPPGAKVRKVPFVPKKGPKTVTAFMRQPGDKAPFPHPCEYPGCTRPWMFAKLIRRTVVAIRCHEHLEMEIKDAEQDGNTGSVRGSGGSINVHAGVSGSGREVAEPGLDSGGRDSGQSGDG